MKFCRRMAFKREERNPCAFPCLGRAAGAWGRGNGAYAEEDAHDAFASGRCQPFFCTLPQRRLELPSLHHISPSASLLALRAPPLTQTSFALLQPYQKMFSLGENRVREKKKNHIFQRRQRNAKLILPALLERAALHSGVSPGGE